MNEISKLLESNERVIWEGKPNYIAYTFGSLINVLIFATIFSLFVVLSKVSKFYLILSIGIPFISFIINQISYNFIHYAITNKRVIIQSGIIGRDFRSIDYDRIQNASVDVGLIGIIFKVGNVKIFTGEMEIVATEKRGSIRPKYDTFANIKDPYEILKTLQERLSHRKETLYSGKVT